ncbi:DUF2397 domain-containing protein [Streptomyces sp. NBC_00237]|uniref:DUF2397 family protein n=1 Tax=Streptomyces sp. NBC_00237 TaxID=2975687 RepID=UPI002254536C|nr:DUF2397 family protein [Streptomyces sp. NBC_00237]MCX5206597.1 DUF2397 domain-containing protein [Streptomyces sp. NBC_00237]
MKQTPSPAVSTASAGSVPVEDFGPFAHLPAPDSALYRQVMAVFLGAKQRFVVHLRPGDVHSAAAPPGRLIPASHRVSTGTNCGP